MSPTDSRLRRIAPGEYENDEWWIKRVAEDDGIDKAVHPITGHTYTPAPVYSWFVYHKASGDLRDAYPTLREARQAVGR